MKLVDSLDDQAVLEAELDGSKAIIPLDCAGLNYLLATPFRYAPYPYGSRFRRAGQREGCFYCSEQVETAIAEAAFYHLNFFLNSPGSTLPVNPQERTAFQVSIDTATAIDLTQHPLVQDSAIWTHPDDYSTCQSVADLARTAGIEAIRYESVRDPHKGANLAILSPTAFRLPAPIAMQTWRILLRHDRVDTMREMPRTTLSFALSEWSSRDPRIPLRIP